MPFWSFHSNFRFRDIFTSQQWNCNPVRQYSQKNRGLIRFWLRYSFYFILVAKARSSLDHFVISLNTFDTFSWQSNYWVTQKIPQICTVILRICIGIVAWFAAFLCGNFWVTHKPDIHSILRLTMVLILDGNSEHVSGKI